LPTNEGVHPREESHGLCHSHGTSSGAMNIVGITPPDGTVAALPPQAIPARAVGRGGWGSYLCESDRFPLCGTSLPPRRQRALCCNDSRSPDAPLPPGPLATRRGRADHVPRGRLPAGNEAINQDGPRVVGGQRTLPSSPLQFSQPFISHSRTNV
jgi:hypothetical protein